MTISAFLSKYFCCKKNNSIENDRTRHHLPPAHGPEDELIGGPPQHHQHNVLRVVSNPSQPPLMSSSGGSHGSESPLPSLSLGMNLRSPRTFTYNELATATNGFSKDNLLGEGGFSFVYKGVLPDGRKVAVKWLKGGSGQEFQAEVEIISQVDHKHLVSLVGYHNDEVKRMLVYDLVPNNTLHFHLHAGSSKQKKHISGKKEPTPNSGSKRPTLDWPTRYKIAIGSAKGLVYLHEDCHPKIIHRDIKATNILLDSDFEAKVADFGLSKYITDSKTHVSTLVRGTFGYMDPEYQYTGKLTFKSDVFSFGVVLLELITGRPARYSDLGLVRWARPLLTQYLVEGKFDTLVDERLQNEYNKEEMASMVVCAIHCLSPSSQDRIRMIEALRILEGGDPPVYDPNEDTISGHNWHVSSDDSYDRS